MKIAFFTPPFPRYSETFIINQVVGLIERGHDVTVFSQGRVDDPVEHGILNKYDLTQRTEYARSIATRKEAIKQYVRSLFGPVSLPDILETVEYGSEGPNRVAAKETLNEAREFDVFHAHFGLIARSWDYLSELPEQVPFIATYYGYDVSEHLHPDNYDFYTKRNHWEAVDLAIGISEHIRSRMMMAGCPEDITTKLPIGIDPDLFQCSPSAYDAGTELKLVSTCRHTGKKGIEYAIRAVGALKNSGVDVSYTIAGSGDLTQLYRDVAAEVGVENDVEFVGRVPQEEVAELMKAAHLYIQPSVTTADGDMEGQGLVFQEAQATGTPPVATFHDGIPEGVRHGETGRLAPERDVSRLTDELAYFVEHPDEIINYAERGRELIESKYDYAKLAAQQEKLYNSVITEKR